MTIILLLTMAGQPDVTARGWNEAIDQYIKDRAPSQHYSMNTHDEAVKVFREGIMNNERKISVYASAVRLVVETVMAARMYITSDHERKGKQ